MAAIIGKEKYLLSKFAAPRIPLPIFQELITLFIWLTDIGWLGKLQTGSLHNDSGIQHKRWHNEALVLYTDQCNLIAIFKPETALKVERAFGNKWKYSFHDWFIPKEEFLRQLHIIQTWRESLSEEELHQYAVELHTPAAALAKVTSIPTDTWHLVLSGLVTKDIYSNTFSADAEKFVGIRTPVLAVLHKYINALGISGKVVIIASWHENYFTTGPNIAAVAEAWQTEFGKLWIQFSNDDIKFLSGHLNQNNLASLLVNEESFQVALSLYSHETFILYMALTQLVEPQSAVAKELAHRIERFQDYQPPQNPVALGGNYEDIQKGSDYANQHAPRALLEGHLDGLLAYLKQGAAVKGTAQDPKVSAPKTVSEVMTILDITENAACYFLQILTLAHPTDALVKNWNGWQKKHLEAAIQELVDKQLVLQAKHVGTGRSTFLPGGWLLKSDTGPAMETWKAPHYLLWKDSKTRPVIPGCPPLLSYGELFAETWNRYKSGDKPGYEELRTTRYRSKH